MYPVDIILTTSHLSIHFQTRLQSPVYLHRHSSHVYIVLFAAAISLVTRLSALIIAAGTQDVFSFDKGSIVKNIFNLVACLVVVACKI